MYSGRKNNELLFADRQNKIVATSRRKTNISSPAVSAPRLRDRPNNGPQRREATTDSRKKRTDRFPAVCYDMYIFAFDGLKFRIKCVSLPRPPARAVIKSLGPAEALIGARETRARLYVVFPLIYQPII